jgi:hypothetical protein
LASSSAAEGLDLAMKNRPGHFSSAKATLRYYLKERKKVIQSGQDIDWSTAQGIWYLVEPYVSKKWNKKTEEWEYLDRDNFVSYIRDICKKDLHCRREDLKIIAGGRADLYFNGTWVSISWDKIEELSETGTDGIMIEKEGMARIFDGLVNPYGFAVINSRGFFVDYLDDISVKAIDKKSNLVLIRDFDPSGILIEIGAKQFGIQCIGVNDEMLQFFGLSREDVQEEHPPSNKNNHWTKVKRLAETTHLELRKEIKFLSKYRIEIDKVHTKVGSRRLFEYVLKKLAEHNRDLNRVIYPDDYVQPNALGRLAYEIRRIGEPAGAPEATEIYYEQLNYDGLCEDIFSKKEENEERVREVIESNKDVKWASEQLESIIKKLKKVKTKTKKQE